MTDENRNEALDWDSEIEHDDGKKAGALLAPGEYRFGVHELTKTVSKNLKCPMAKLRIGIFALEDAEFKNLLAEVEDNLVLHSTCEWKLCQFFRAIGERKHGERFRPNWAQVPGACGRCKVIVETFEKRDKTEGKNNKIERYIDPYAGGHPPAASRTPDAGGQKPEALAADGAAQLEF